MTTHVRSHISQIFWARSFTTRQSKGLLYPWRSFNSYESNTPDTRMVTLTIDCELDLWDNWSGSGSLLIISMRTVFVPSYMVIHQFIKVSYSANTAMCSLTFKCLVWSCPLRFGLGVKGHCISSQLGQHSYQVIW